MDHIISVSNKDKIVLINRYNINPQKVSVIPSGSYLFDINPSLKGDLKNSLNISSDKIVIFFHGLYTHLPNKEAIDIIINYIAPKFEGKNILFLLAGNKLPTFENKNIRSLGFVEDLHSLLSIVDIAIVPLIQGEGTKLKIFDYMMAGLPIVTTKKGAEGIEIENEIHALITDEPNERFIEAIKYLITHKGECLRLAAAAKELAKEQYEWLKIGSRLKDLYLDITDESKWSEKETLNMENE